MLLFDEVKIKEGLVFYAATWELLSFTDIDDDCHLLFTVTHKCQGKTFFFDAKSFSRQNVPYQGKTFFLRAKLSFSRQNFLTQGKTSFLNAKLFSQGKTFFLKAKLSSQGKTFFLKAKFTLSRQNFLLMAKLSFSRQNFLLRAKLSFMRQNLLSLAKAFFSRPLPRFSILRMCSSQCFHIKDGRAQQGGDDRLDHNL